jgi:hypothetical protein
MLQMGFESGIAPLRSWGSYPSSLYSIYSDGACAEARHPIGAQLALVKSVPGAEVGHSRGLSESSSAQITFRSFTIPKSCATVHIWAVTSSRSYRDVPQAGLADLNRTLPSLRRALRPHPLSESRRHRGGSPGGRFNAGASKRLRGTDERGRRYAIERNFAAPHAFVFVGETLRSR